MLDILRFVEYALKMVEPMGKNIAPALACLKRGKDDGRTHKSLGPLEQEIMNELWKGEALSGKEIFEGIRRQRVVALTTVLTVVERLHKKGFVTKSRSATVYLFAPAYSREEFARKVSSEVLREIFELSANGAFASFVDAVAERDPVELDRLAKLIEKKKKEMKGKKAR